MLWNAGIEYNSRNFHFADGQAQYYVGRRHVTGILSRPSCVTSNRQISTGITDTSLMRVHGTRMSSDSNHLETTRCSGWVSGPPAFSAPFNRSNRCRVIDGSVHGGPQKTRRLYNSNKS